MDSYKKYLKYKKKYLLLKASFNSTQNKKGGGYSEPELINLPTEIIYNILTSLSIKEIMNLKFVNKRLNEISSSYIQNYISKRLYEKNIDEAIYLYSLPKYNQLIKPFLIRYLQTKVNNIVELFTTSVVNAGGPISSNHLKLNGGIKYEILFKTNNRIIKISNIGPANIAMCDVYSSIVGRRNAGRQIDISEIPSLLSSFVMNGVNSMREMKISLTEYIYQPGSLAPSNINILIY